MPQFPRPSPQIHHLPKRKRVKTVRPKACSINDAFDITVRLFMITNNLYTNIRSIKKLSFKTVLRKIEFFVLRSNTYNIISRAILKKNYIVY